MNDIVQFPKTFKTHPDNQSDDTFTSIEDVDNRMYAVKAYHITEVSTHLAETFFNGLQICGFPLDLENMETHKDIAFLMETMKSMMMRHYGMTHPLHSFVEEKFIVGDDEMIQMVVEKDK